ncbi:MAG: hypothetical protein L0323_08135 [Planctomycetes bacterium]|nr:hypothetical protein [Planctomycetota bacterium]
MELERIRSVVPILLLASACAGGGGGSGGGGGPGLDDGEYTIEAFGYEDPHPADFHPLGVDTARLRHLSEVAIFAGRATSIPAGTTPWVLDDADHAHAPIPPDYGSFLAGTSTVIAAASGQLDLDPENEVVLVASVGLGEALRVGVLERVPAGGIAVTTIYEFATGWSGTTTASLALGDLDGDGRDELVITYRKGLPGTPSSSPRRWTVRDDPADGNGAIHEEDLPFWVTDASVACADLDGEGPEEIALLEQEGDYAVHLDARRVTGGTVQPAAAPLAIPLVFEPAGRSVVLAGRFDPDAREEVVVAYGADLFIGFGMTVNWQVVDLTGGGVLVPASSGEIQVDQNPFFLDERWSGCAADLDGDGLDEVAVLGPEGDLRVAVPSGAANGLEGEEIDASLPFDDAGTTLLAVQDDEDPRTELCALGVVFGNTHVLSARWFGAIPQGGTNVLASAGSTQQILFPPPTPSGGSLAALAACEGDLDGDDLTLRFTGEKHLSLADPIPLVAMAAPPTKSGIAQNYGSTQTVYTMEQGLAETFGVSASATLSFSSGVAVGDVLGLFGVTARATIAASFEQTQTSTHLVTQGISFSGAHDRDLVVFQGTLYHSYVYEIVAGPDPALVGTTMSLDAPIDSKVFKWSIEHYDSIAPQAIGPLAFSHGIGDPASYPTEAEAGALLSTYVGWLGNEATVGLGGNANEVFLAIDETNSTSSQWSYGVTWETGFHVGGASVGFSVGATTSTMVEVATVLGTEYRGRVGDITSGADYGAWLYDFGLLVYQRGVLADSQGQPAGIEPGVQPFHVVTYWTDPIGTGY